MNLLKKAPKRWPTMLLSALLSTPWVGACTPKPPTPNPTPSEPSPCEAYCAHLRALGCPQAAPTAKGATCEEICINIENSGYVQSARECSMRAMSCAEIDVCED